MAPTLRETLSWGTHWIYDRVAKRWLQPFYDRIARRRPEARAVLDVGCGPGHLAAAIARMHPQADVLGIDIDPVQVERARRNHHRDNLSFDLGASTRIPLPDGSRDWAMATEAFHHWSEPEASLAEIHRALAPGGEFWIVEGAADVRKGELASWTRRKPLPGLTACLRLAWRHHGYTPQALHGDLLPMVEGSPFGAADVEREDGWWIVRAVK